MPTQNSHADLRSKLDKLWTHVSATRTASEIMLEFRRIARSALLKRSAGGLSGARLELRRFASRIAKPIAGREFDYVPGVAPLLFPVRGEWHITNADLEFWSALSLFGSRDFFGEDWDTLTCAVDRALKSKRRYQTWLRYQRRKGVREDHRLLLASIRWQMDFSRGDWMSLFVDGKHPAGDSSRAMSFVRAMGWPDKWSSRDKKAPATVIEKAWEVFDELPFALADIFRKPSNHGHHG